MSSATAVLTAHITVVSTLLKLNFLTFVSWHYIKIYHQQSRQWKTPFFYHSRAKKSRMPSTYFIAPLIQSIEIEFQLHFNESIVFGPKSHFFQTKGPFTGPIITIDSDGKVIKKLCPEIARNRRQKLFPTKYLYIEFRSNVNCCLHIYLSIQSIRLKIALK